MARRVTYWVTTIMLAALSVLAAYGYLSGSPQSVQGFAHVGYPQQLRIILGIAKPLGAIALIVPGMVKLKEWAYAGFTFAWISALKSADLFPLRLDAGPFLSRHSAQLFERSLFV